MPQQVFLTSCMANYLEVIVTKEQLRAELERQAQRYKDVYGGEVITYAAQPDPEKKPWRKRPNLLDHAFERELEKIRKEQQAKANPLD